MTYIAVSSQSQKVIIPIRYIAIILFFQQSLRFHIKDVCTYEFMAKFKITGFYSCEAALWQCPLLKASYN